MPARRRNDDGGARNAARRPNCPVCRTSVAPDGSLFPFCSKRCRLIDLGRWLGGAYRIEVPVEATDRELAPDVDPDSLPDAEDMP